MSPCRISAVRRRDCDDSNPCAEKNIPGEPVCEAITNGAITPAHPRKRLAEEVSTPAKSVGNCSERYIRTAGKQDSTVMPVIRVPASKAIVAAETI